MVQGGDGDEVGGGLLLLSEWLLTSHCKVLLICTPATRTRTTASSKSFGQNLEIKLKAPVFFFTVLYSVDIRSQLWLKCVILKCIAKVPLFVLRHLILTRGQ